MFLVCGEILFDVFAADGEAGALQLDARPGGSPFNVAVGLARLGQRVAFAGALSTDFLGERLAAELAREGIDCTGLARKDRPTTLGLVTLDATGSPDFAFYGEGAADCDFTPSDLGTISPDVRAIHVGSYSTIVEPIASTIEVLVRAQGGRRFVSYDPNVRVKVVPDISAWRARIDAFAPRADLLKISMEDACAIYPGVSKENLATMLLGKGCPLVVVTSGAGGAAAWTKAAQARCAAKDVAVADTVGAGDSFQAALLAAIAERNLFPEIGKIDAATLQDILEFASRAAAITCARRGADMPRRAELA